MRIKLILFFLLFYFMPVLVMAEDVSVCDACAVQYCPSGVCKYHADTTCHCQNDDTGGGSGSCRDRTVNCAAGATRSLNQPLYNECMTAWGGSFCSPYGTAQVSSGNNKDACCSGFHKATPEEPWDVCDNPTITTYACCASGTVDTKITGSTYTLTNSCFRPTTCSDADDEYISNVSNPAAGVCYVGCSEVNPNTGNCRAGKSYNVYNVTTTCREIHYACVNACTAGTAPTLNTPANAQIYAGPSGAASVNFSWNAPSSWGTETGTGTRNYSLCVGTNASNPCTGGTTTTSTTTSATVSVPYGTQYWGVKASNVCGSASAISEIRNVCVEGFTLPGDNGVGNAYFSQWGACNASTHKRTRTCREDCGTDNCTAAAEAGLLEEDCTGEIRGTIFDATELSSCPSFDPATGYLIGVDTTLTANNRSFVMADQNVTAPHPWSLITPAETNSAGNYSVRVYAPATYTYDFSDLSDMYVVSSGPKLTCTSTNAVVAGSPSSCGTQPCTTVNNMSFGFDRYWSGWWQVVGASVHGENGIKSSIPSSLLTEQSLILGDSAAGNRRGVVSFGQRVSNMLGLNQNAKVSTNLWQVLSNYDGVVYDYDYFNQQFKKYSTTVWDGTGTVTYDDAGKGYQIFKVAGSVANFSYNPTGVQKVIFLINGDVTINSNLVVPDGAFMAVLSSGNINFGTSVTRADGWYLGDNITISCTDVDNNSECDRTDVQFLGNGSFVSWKGTTMTRDMGGPANIAGPAEKFTYRMDLYNNAPDPMKIFTKKYKPYVP